MARLSDRNKNLTAVPAPQSPDKAGFITDTGNNGTVPDGWLVCDGSAVSRTTYAELFAEIGTTYGVGDGSTTFNLPNLDTAYINPGNATDFPDGITLSGGTDILDAYAEDSITSPNYTNVSGTFNHGMKFVKVGKTVTMTLNASGVGNCVTSPAFSAAAVPADFRPTSNKRLAAVYTVNGSIGIRQIFIFSSGRVDLTDTVSGQSFQIPTDTVITWDLF